MGGKTIVRAPGEGEHRWFYGGGRHTWKVNAEEAGGAMMVLEDELERGKVTPLHEHPASDELVYVIEGEILSLSGGVERTVGPGAVIFTPRGVHHAFAVVSDKARILFVQTPGAIDAFYRTASEPATAADGPVDFAKIRAAAESTGGTVVHGPPPFGPRG